MLAVLIWLGVNGAIISKILNKYDLVGMFLYIFYIARFNECHLYTYLKYSARVLFPIIVTTKRLQTDTTIFSMCIIPIRDVGQTVTC